MNTQSGISKRRHNLGRVLVVVYAIMSLSAFARSSYQIIRKFEVAPVAFTLSAVSAVVYIVATIAIAKGLDKLALVTISIELLGVIAVGIWSIAAPAMFPESTVWSEFGMGYAFIPLIAPILGLLWVKMGRKS